jgi:hypothetical protein
MYAAPHHARILWQNYVRVNPWPFYLSWALSFGMLLVLACNERLRRK